MKNIIFDFKLPLDTNQANTLDINLSKLGPLHMVLNQFVNFTSKHQQPIIAPSSILMPERISALYRIVKKTNLYNDVCPHFFTGDEHIEPAWTHPFSYWLKLRKFGRCISPDLSIFENMVRDQKRWNSFRNKFLTALWQRFGIDVIPAPSWGNIADIDYYLEGWPKRSVIAINSTGIGHNRHSQSLFLDGYYAMLDILKPKYILRYGTCIDGENKEISTFFPNDAKMEVTYGRK